MNAPLIITIDGPAGVGKSTLAAGLARVLDLPYLDTGAMFRTVALNLGEAGADLPAPELEKAVAGLRFELAGAGEQSELLVNGKPAGSEIRSETVGKLASRIARRPEIRTILKDIQRGLGSRTSLVAEGRDLGTVVFPKAAVKFFLDARPEVRAERRWRELTARGEQASLAEIAGAIRARDEQDRNRAVAPLRPAPDAILIDTSDMSIEAALKLLEQESRSRIAAQGGSL